MKCVFGIKKKKIYLFMKKIGGANFDLKGSKHH